MTNEKLEPAAWMEICSNCGLVDVVIPHREYRDNFEVEPAQCGDNDFVRKELAAVEDIIQWLSNKEQSLRATANRPIEEVGNEKHDAEVKANLLAKLQEEFSEDMRSKNDDRQ